MMAPPANTHVEECPDSGEDSRVGAGGTGDMATSAGGQQYRADGTGDMAASWGGTIQRQQDQMCHDRNASVEKRMRSVLARA